MPEFQVSFIIAAKNVGDVLLALNRFKIQALDLHPVAQPGKKGKQNGKPGWQILGEYIISAKDPVRPRDLQDVMIKAGFNSTGISTHLASAVKNGLIKKTPKGYVKK